MVQFTKLSIPLKILFGSLCRVCHYFILCSGVAPFISRRTVCGFFAYYMQLWILMTMVKFLLGSICLSSWWAFILLLSQIMRQRFSFFRYFSTLEKDSVLAWSNMEFFWHVALWLLDLVCFSYRCSNAVFLIPKNFLQLPFDGKQFLPISFCSWNSCYTFVWLLTGPAQLKLQWLHSDWILQSALLWIANGYL